MSKSNAMQSYPFARCINKHYVKCLIEIYIFICFALLSMVCHMVWFPHFISDHNIIVKPAKQLTHCYLDVLKDQKTTTPVSLTANLSQLLLLLL